MGAIVKGISSVLIALGIIAIVGTGIILYYNKVKPESEETVAEAQTNSEADGTEGEAGLSEGMTETETPTADTINEAGILPSGSASSVFSAENGHQHTYTKTVLKPATCTEAGEAKYTCYCGDYYMDSIPATDHILGDWITVRSATTTQTGLRHMSCVVCGRTIHEEVIPMLASTSSTDSTTNKNNGKNNTTDHKHSYTYEITTEATCTSKGEKTYTCATCGSTFKTTIPATNHPTRKTIRTEGDCGNPGKIETTCMICNAVISSETLNYDHNWGSWTTTTEPTATTTGTQTRTCKKCGQTETRTLSATGSSSGSSTGSGGTGTGSSGSSGGDPTCSHTYNSVVTTQPSCTAAGVTTYTCSKCGNTYTEAAPAAKGHNPGNWTITKQATTQEEGEQVRYCRTCGQIVSTEILPKLATVHEHTWVQTIDKQPTCTQTGTRRYTCSECGYYYTTSIRQLGHNFVNGVCSVCGISA